MEFVIATNNQHKLLEIRRILLSLGHMSKSLAEADLVCNPDETGSTFAQNALIKGKAICDLCGMPTIADDSGLVVDALDGAPGVYSARFAGEGGDEANNQKLLRLMAKIPLPQRSARFVSAIALVLPGGRLLQVEGTCEGTIGFEKRGTNGFGYDPLFYILGKSFAQMTDKQKDEMSHRARALVGFAQKLPSFLHENF